MNTAFPPDSFARSCVRCIFNNVVDPDIYFDEQGLCNHCVFYDKTVAPLLKMDRSAELTRIVDAIKKDGKGKRYDCIIGVSGGVDSSYVAHVVKELGLRPLAVHCDNGWNTELAVSNISNLLTKLVIDLYTHVINWDEFKDIQLAYLKASVIDVEAPSDHAIAATMYRQAARFGVKHILSGENFITEGYLPESWVHMKNDLVNIKAIHRQFGHVPMKSFPTLGLIKRFYYEKVRGIRYVPILDYVHYVKSDAKKLLMDRYDWRDYGGKHYESIITRFYQSYILPVKFGVDKRYSHLSTLICTGQITRAEALAEVAKPPYDPQKMIEDKRYVAKKFGLTEEGFDALMALPVRSHFDYPSVLDTFETLRPLVETYKNITGRSRTYPVKRKQSAAVLVNNACASTNDTQTQRGLPSDRDVTVFAVTDPSLPSYETRKGIKIRRVFEPDASNRRKQNAEARRIAQKGFGLIQADDARMLEVAQLIQKLCPDCDVADGSKP